MNFAAIVRAVDAALALGDAARKGRAKAAEPLDEAVAASSEPPAGFTDRIEARLTNVVVAALKEAFDRDHARLEIERAHLDEGRRRAEAVRRLELRRWAVDHEMARLRWIGAAGLGGWLASVLVLGLRIAEASTGARLVLGLGWALLLATMAATFVAQGRLARLRLDDELPGESGTAGRTAVWLLVSGLALETLSLLL